MATSITPAQVAALEQAIASGTLEVQWESGGARQRMVYQSIDQMLRALAYAKGQLAEPLSQPQPSTLAVFNRC